MDSRKIEISTATILKTLLLLISLWLVYYLKDVLFLLFVSFIFMSAFNPWVDRLEKDKVPRWLAVLFFYLVFFGMVFIALVSVIPSLIEQTQALIHSLPVITRSSIEDLKLGGIISERDVQFFAGTLMQHFSDKLILAPGGIFRVGAGIVGSFFDLVSFFVITFYLLLEHKHFKLSLSKLLRTKHQERFLNNLAKVEEKLGAWLRGEAFLMLVIGLLTYLGLVVLVRTPFALPLAIVAGLLEIVPILGPITAAVPAVIVAAAFSPWKIVSVILLYTLIQQLENSLIVPNVMRKAVGLDPLLVLLALIVGAKLDGPLGALLAVPILAVGVILVDELLLSARNPKQHRNQP